MLKVLSVDWDYFVDADASVRSAWFPDTANEEYGCVFVGNSEISGCVGGGLSEGLRCTAWYPMYGEHKGLVDIGVDPLVYRLVEDIRNVPCVFVADSHRWAYRFVVEMMERRNERKLFLLNIDFHSDCRRKPKFFCGSDVLDCGNWLLKLMEGYKGVYRWLGRKDSFMGHKPNVLSFLDGYGKAKVGSTAWDMVFVSRSEMCSPPHLDKEFVKVFKPFVSSKNGRFQSDIWRCRDCPCL